MSTEATPPAFDQVAAAVMPAGLGSTRSAVHDRWIDGWMDRSFFFFYK